MTRTNEAAAGSQGAALPKYRALAFGVTRASVRVTAEGVRYVQAEAPLQPYAHRMTDRLLHWAEATPERTFIAQRARLPDGRRGDWVHVSYREMLAKARAIGQALLARGVSAERPVAILAENGIDHALVAFGCLLVGVPHCPVSPPYALVSKDFEKLRHVMGTLTPGLVFASDARYGAAIAATVPADVEVVLGEGQLEDRATTPLAALLATVPTPAVDEAMAHIHPGTITKFLFTSGSTKNPKAVINTHRMWCANQQQMRQSIPALGDEPPVLVDWLPWNHTFGGNHNVGIALDNGGTLYVDEGKPTPGGIAETLRNLREIAPTVYFNVPTGFEAIADAMETDAALRRSLLSRARMFFYAGAALPQAVWDKLHRIQEAEIGERLVMGTGLGMTESGPFALYITRPEVATGDLGLPAAGMELKLVPTDGKTEIRYRGPNVTPGYWRMPDATHESFDEEGFFSTGDAVEWIDPQNPHLGLRFDGRIAEDFKLATGTFVSVGPLRAKITAYGAPYVQDAVLTGINLKEVGALVFPTQAVRELARLPADAPMAEVVAHHAVQAHFQHVLDKLAADATGSANRIARAVLVAEPPSIDKGEVTDKGSINQRAVLKHRDAAVQALHGGTLPHTITPR
ncbi:feruloyl-CoA synthase [Pseudorhodoferax sp. Leaf274]|uniref:feruloyl-CoA synthase n=1 Tax=Pseudorhodoferax sp. Leaf274 TaxID=1736318 RepID=UPI0007024B3A|nr:feruloyl-CoA synthase [Pseudorhodoferax sp. Leaf274]KQP36162.1 feruloyl-CoA synthase [Pseudorhodoferax sp. Leaf274]